ncbi:P-loop containing nucleoside triphosphate hydrolase protein [Meredithblackwellia eburnea MCA 4105]
MSTQKRIKQYSDIAPVSSLLAYPLTEKTKRALQERGLWYLQNAGQIHAWYSGFFLAKGTGELLKMYNDGPIILDVKSYRRFNPVHDTWSDNVNKPQQPSMYPRDGSASAGDKFSADLAYLLPPMIHGFSLKSKRWGEFSVDCLKPIPSTSAHFDSIIMPPHYARLITSLIKVHSDRSLKSQVITDVVEGKGQGLIIALHGPPGTGKTLTAELVSAHSKRPLYSIGTSELGTTAASVEKKLQEAFALASAWDAIVLLDEADILLEQRDSVNLERNALVGVFLRELEYYRGIMLLTTNRLSRFDEAFASRFALTLKFNELDFEDRRRLWKQFLGRSTLHLLDKELDFVATKQLNGRVIKSTIQTAQALALAEDREFTFADVHCVLELAA